MRARPKSIILMRLPVFVGHKMFSGCKERKKREFKTMYVLMYLANFQFNTEIISNFRLNHIGKSNIGILYLSCNPIDENKST